MPRGRKKNYKGSHRHFTNEDEMARLAEKERKQKEWREAKGLGSEEEDDHSKDGAAAGAAASGPAAAKAPAADGVDDDDDDDEEDEEDKPKGVSHLIEIENPNRVQQKTKKVTDLKEGAPAELSRREREELEKQRAKENYDRLHLAGKTEAAQADLARLALIRKQREDAAKKREDEKAAQAEVKAAAEKRLLEKKAKAGGS